MKVRLIQTNFTAGEISPQALGRVDLAKYQNGVRHLDNFFINPLGGVKKRSGTRFVASAKYRDKESCLETFAFSDDETYKLEIGHKYIRFFKGHSQIVSNSGLPFEVATPYLESEVREIQYAQAADVLYIVHKNHPVKKLVRYSDFNWVLEDVVFKDGPYLDENIEDITLSSSGRGVVDKEVEITSSAALFSVEDEGRLLRIRVEGGTSKTGWVESAKKEVGAGKRISITSKDHKLVTGQYVTIIDVNGTVEINETWQVEVSTEDLFYLKGSEWKGKYDSGGQWETSGRLGYGTISEYISETKVKMIAEKEIPLGKTLNWRLGAWCKKEGYPRCISFYSGRLGFGGSKGQPQTGWLSLPYFFENFEPSAEDGTVRPDHAITFTISSNRINVFQWMAAGSVLLIGTSGSEWIVKPAKSTEGLSPNNIQAAEQTSHGSNFMQAQRVGGAVVFVQRGGRRIREMGFDFSSDSYVSKDMSILSEHLLRSGVKRMAWQLEPYGILWIVCNDGSLVSLTYLKEHEVLGLSRQTIGGFYKGGVARVESVSVKPHPTLGVDEVWFIVKRTINGKTERYIEYLEAAFEPKSKNDKDDMIFLDCSASLDNRVAIESLEESGGKIKIGVSGHGYEDGDIVRVSGLNGFEFLNWRNFSIEVIDVDNFLLGGEEWREGVTYWGGGVVTKRHSVVGGLDYLEAENVSILSDGANKPLEKVSEGKVSLKDRGGVVHVGLPYSCSLNTLAVEIETGSGTAQGSVKRVNKICLRIVNSLSCLLGVSKKDVTPVSFRDYSDKMDQSPPLFSGDKTEGFSADYDLNGDFWIVQNEPYPLELLAIVSKMGVYLND